MLDPSAALLDAARRIGPGLREACQSAEETRRLPAAVFEALAEAGLQRMLLPRSLGGHETDPVTCARVVEEVARFDATAAWALQSGNTGAWWSARLPQEGVETIYRDGPDVLLAAAFHPPQQAIETADGYRVTGRAPLASNVHDSQWFMMTAFVMDGDHPRLTGGMPEVIAVALPTREVQIVDTWDALGLRASDSNDVAVDKVLVPRSRSFPMAPEFEPGPHFRGPLYRFPAMGQVGLIIAPILLAIARAAIDELRELATRKTPFGSLKTLREKNSVQTNLARAEGVLRAARAYYYEAIGAAWETTAAGRACSLETKAEVLLAGVHAAQSAVDVVERMHRLAGTSAIYRRNRLERHLRDAETLRHHGFVTESRYETVGQVFLGVPPEFPLVAF
jgi:alkylation response protein AidB-like acyl-CoA dehydrogenase